MLKKIFSAVLITMFVIGTSAVSQAATFNDVPAGHWANGAIEKLVADGVIKADGKNFNGNNNATRYDMTMMLAGLFNKVSTEKATGEVPFSDIPANHPAYDAVRTMAALGVMEGYGDGTFLGDREITREELAMTINTFLEKGGLTFENASSSFSDVPSGHWAYRHVSRMYSEKFMEGYGDGTFKGKNKITKLELALIIAKIDDKYFS